MVGYRQFHGLTRPPFGKAIEADQLLLYPQLQELCQELDELLLEGGVGLLTGEMGIGKTTALRHYFNLLQIHSVQLQVAYYGSSRHSVALLAGLVEALGMAPTHQRVPLLRQLTHHVERTYREQRKKTLLCIDDAHLLEDGMLEDLRLATNVGMDSEDAVVVLLVGHPALRARLAKPVHLALLDRVRLHYKLEGLSRDETEAYLDHHLKQAGGRPEIFSSSARLAIFEHSGGIPRRINALALLALKKSATRKLTSIDADFIKAVLPMLIQS
jgi:type II secretory pathway predicted ATPase ExeA